MFHVQKNWIFSDWKIFQAGAVAANLVQLNCDIYKANIRGIFRFRQTWDLSVDMLATRPVSERSHPAQCSSGELQVIMWVWAGAQRPASHCCWLAAPGTAVQQATTRLETRWTVGSAAVEHCLPPATEAAPTPSKGQDILSLPVAQPY